MEESEEHFRAFVTASFDVVYRMNADWSELRYLAGKDLIADTTEPSSTWLATYIHPDDQARVRQAIDSAIATKDTFTLEHRVRRVDGSVGWVASRAVPFFDKAGNLVGWLGTATDVTEQRRHDERQKMLLHELNHRVKNTLATIQSIMIQTLRSAKDTSEARQALEARLMALSKAHDVLTREEWSRANLREIVTVATATCAERFDIEGRSMFVRPHAALALSLAFHELSSNATKYGALSNSTGRISVRWQAIGDRFTLEWKERGGPIVEPPRSRGFGSRLIAGGLPQDLGGNVRLDFASTGVTCTISNALLELDESHRHRI